MNTHIKEENRSERSEPSDLTLDYYNHFGREFIKQTRDVDFSETQNRFLDLLPESGTILDFGCGSGRDSKCFLDRGYSVIPLDGSPLLCRQAEEYLGIPVLHQNFLDFQPDRSYTGIWACASLLHLPLPDLKKVFHRLADSLENKGIFYLSFKYGRFQGIRNGRWFTDLDEPSFMQLIENEPDLKIINIWKTEDVRGDHKSQTWLNALLRKEIKSYHEPEK